MNEVPEEQRQQQELSRLVPDVPGLVVRCIIYNSCKIYTALMRSASSLLYLLHCTYFTAVEAVVGQRKRTRLLIKRS